MKVASGFLASRPLETDAQMLVSALQLGLFRDLQRLLADEGGPLGLGRHRQKLRQPDHAERVGRRAHLRQLVPGDSNLHTHASQQISANQHCID